MLTFIDLNNDHKKEILDLLINFFENEGFSLADIGIAVHTRNTAYHAGFFDILNNRKKVKKEFFFERSRRQHTARVWVNKEGDIYNNVRIEVLGRNNVELVMALANRIKTLLKINIVVKLTQEDDASEIFDSDITISI